MDRKKFLQLVKEAREEFSTYSFEQRVRVLEKIEAIDKKIRLQEKNDGIVKPQSSSTVNESADFLEEK
jgi:hypothetical protein